MINTKRNQHRRERQFKVGDAVRVYQPPVGKTDKKVGRVFVGPYIVIEVIQHGKVPSEYICSSKER